ncbi:class I SAM-dependent methyltransferase [Flavobacterium sp.]|uniref:class I SAM-dependent methyltransferase n=1 Tax=Flavobacterium sp. TaxID=239 RepID=UPI002B4B31F0|nr:class I SAM-dependent methyltransferase [Flavobacterium sp.]HLP63702.1 class I SAM-dependent methyltransferase [Flavobacterium sp.]
MKVQNKEFWEIDNVIDVQDKIKKATDFEMFMFEKAKERFASFGGIKSIKIFGCGTGREIESIAEFFEPNRIVASDIAENMITKCDENLKEWKLDSITQTLVMDAKDFNNVYNEFDLVTILNSMLTYVVEKNDRLAIFKNSYQIAKPNGVLIGTVHNQEGTFLKTAYFKLRNLLSFYYGDKVGYRNTGYNGYKVPGYYYSKKDLHNDIKNAGFKSIDVYSLEEYYRLIGLTYNRKTGYNNLIFIAQK